MQISSESRIIVYGLKALFAEQKGKIREIRPVWALEEIGIPYDLVILNPHTREHKTEEFLKMNPFGKVPTIKDGDFSLFESAAICTYIGDKYKKLVPAAGTQSRAKYDQWISVILTSIEAHAGRIFACDFFYDQDDETKHLKNFAQSMLANFLPVVEQHLKQNKYLVGNEFTVADIAMTGALNFIHHTDILSEYPQLKKYLSAIHDRPAYQKAFALNAPMQ